MSRWLAQGLTSLTQLREQASEFAQEVLNETRVEVEDPVAQLAVSRTRITELEANLAANFNEISTLRENNGQLQERVATAEYQLQQIEQEKHQRLIDASSSRLESEGWTINLDSPPLPPCDVTRPARRDYETASGELPLSPTSFEFEVRKLKDEVKQLQAECAHWKQLVKRQETDQPDNSIQDSSALIKEVEHLKQKLSDQFDEYQSELLALQDEHRIQLSQLREQIVVQQEHHHSSENVSKSVKNSNWENDWEEDDAWTETSLRANAEKNDENGTLQKLQIENDNFRMKLEEYENRFLVGSTVSSSSSDLANIVTELKNEKENLEKSLLELDHEHQAAMEHVLKAKEELSVSSKQCKVEMDDLRLQLEKRDSTIAQLECETKELSEAYNDLNDQYEKQKQESGNVVMNNRELMNRLDALKGDLIEYEEKYERCKVENEKAVRQLEMLTNEFDKLKQDLAHNRSIDDPRKWQEQILKLTSELEDSLKKREELISNVGKFQEVCESFEDKVNKFRDENHHLRQENAELSETLAGFGDLKQTFADSDEELSEIRRSLKEQQLIYLKKELVWREQVEQLTEENEVLKRNLETCQQPEHQRLNGQLVKLSETNGSNGDSSYIHIEMLSGGEEIGHRVKSDEEAHTSGTVSTSGENIEILSRQLSPSAITNEMLQSENETLKHQIDALQKVVLDKQSLIAELEHFQRESAEQRESFQKEKSDLTCEIVALQKMIVEKESVFVEMENSRIEESNKRLESLEHEKESLKHKISGLQSTVLDKQIAFDELDNSQRQNLQQLESLENVNKTLKQGIDELQNVILEKQRAFDELETIHRQNFQSNIEHVELLRTENETLKRQIDELQNVMLQKQRAIDEMETFDSINQQIGTGENDALKRQVDALQKVLLENQRVIADTENFQRQTETIRNENETLKRRIDELQNVVSENQRTIGETENFHRQNLQLNNEQLQSVQTENENLNRQIDGLQNVILENQRIIAEMENVRHQHVDSNNQEQALEISNLKNDLKHLDSVQQKLIGAENALTSLQDEKQQLVILVNQKHEECLRYHHELQKALQSFSDEKTQREVLKRKLDALANQPVVECSTQTEIDSVQRESAQVQQQLEQCRMEIDHLRTELDQRNLMVSRMESQLREHSQQNSNFREQFRKEMDSLVQGKDRAIAELSAERQHSQRLVEQVHILEDNYQKSSKEVERLRQHLVQIEDAYTNEAVKAEERETTLRKRLKEVEDQLFKQMEVLKDGSQQFTDQISDLKIQLEALADQRDSALLHLADVQMELERNQKSLASLQNVLQHFQQERDSKVFGEVEKYKHEIESWKEQKLNYEKAIRDLQNRISENHEAMKASSVIMDQISTKDRAIEYANKQLATVEDKCVKLEAKIVELQKIRDGKLDKDVLKNMLLSYFCAPATKKSEVGHLLGSVLGFSAEEFKKCESGGGGGWLQFLRLSSGGGESAGAGHRSTEQSLASQFIKFLETESVPKPPAVAMTVTDPVSSSSNVSRSTTPGAGSFRLELPSFSSATTRGMSSIEDNRRSESSSDFLRDVFKSSSENL